MKEKLFGEQQSQKNYFPKDNSKLFECDLNLVDWLRQYSKEQDETYIRSFFGSYVVFRRRNL